MAVSTTMHIGVCLSVYLCMHVADYLLWNFTYLCIYISIYFYVYALCLRVYACVWVCVSVIFVYTSSSLSMLCVSEFMPACMWMSSSMMCGVCEVSVYSLPMKSTSQMSPL